MADTPAEEADGGATCLCIRWKDEPEPGDRITAMHFRYMRSITVDDRCSHPSVGNCSGWSKGPADICYGPRALLCRHQLGHARKHRCMYYAR